MNFKKLSLMLFLSMLGVVTAQGMSDAIKEQYSILNKDIMPFFKEWSPLLPTVRHIKKYGICNLYMVKQCLEDPLLKNLINQVLEKEQYYINDYYTFIHGQRREYYFSEKLYTFLWQIKHKKVFDDFFFPHVKNLVPAHKIIDEEAVSDSLIANGSPGDISKLLYMNYALFGNASRQGSCSMLYILASFNQRGRLIGLQHAFVPFNYERIYERFKDEILSLNDEYNKLCSHGNLLFIAIPKERINRSVFSATPQGGKIPIYIDDIGMTSDMGVIMDTLLNDPEKIDNKENAQMIMNADRLEFCLIMTQKNGGMDPDSGIKIFPLLTGDPVKLAELQKKEDALFAKIKAAIEEEEKTKGQAAAVARVGVIANHIAPTKDAAPLVPAKIMARINMIMNHVQSSVK